MLNFAKKMFRTLVFQKIEDDETRIENPKK